MDVKKVCFDEEGFIYWKMTGNKQGTTGKSFPLSP